MTDHHVVDITIIGAGPVGLAAAYYAGHRDASVRIVESLGQLGGQVAAVYPEKHVYDVAGHPKIQGQALVDLCVEQGLQFGAEVFLDQEVKDLQRVGVNGEEQLILTTHEGETFPTRMLIVTAGHGAFEPRKLEIEDIVEGDGDEAVAGRIVEVHYVGVSWKTGKQFDASWDRGDTFKFGLGKGQVIRGWDQGVAGMKVGGRRMLIIPPDLGYGPNGSPPVIKPNETLVFVVDLLAVQ